MTEAGVVAVDVSNAEQLRAWNGDEGAYWAAHPDHFDRAVARHHARLMSTAAIGGAERVLDIGCGTGQTTRDAARAASSGSALGVDLSGAMLAVARRRAAAEGVTNIAFEQVDAQIHPFLRDAFDVAISRTGATFFGEPAAAFTNVAGSIRAQGRLVLLTWQPMSSNEWIREFSGALAAGRALPTPPPDAPGPFALADPDRIRRVLSEAGFVDVDLHAVEEPMWFGDDADDAHRLISGLLGWMIDGLDERSRGRALEALHATMAAHETRDGVLFDSAAWLVHARRR